MENEEVEFNWDKMAEAYEAFTNGEDSYSNVIEWRNIEKLIPSLENKIILDLGCGTGRFSFLFEQYRPRQIIGIDISEEMIKIGKKIGQERNSIVEFVQKDIEKLSDFQANSIDFIFSSTVLHYIEDLNPIMKEINRLLVPGGTCILSVINPVYSACYPVAKVNGTFPKDEEWTIKYLDKSIRAYIQPWIEYTDGIDNFLSYSYHHTMADYINSIVKGGLQIEELLEPLPPEEWKSSNAGRYNGYVETPVYAIFKLKKV